MERPPKYKSSVKGGLFLPFKLDTMNTPQMYKFKFTNTLGTKELVLNTEFFGYCYTAKSAAYNLFFRWFHNRYDTTEAEGFTKDLSSSLAIAVQYYFTKAGFTPVRHTESKEQTMIQSFLDSINVKDPPTIKNKGKHKYEDSTFVEIEERIMVLQQTHLVKQLYLQILRRANRIGALMLGKIPSESISIMVKTYWFIHDLYASRGSVEATVPIELLQEYTTEELSTMEILSVEFFVRLKGDKSVDSKMAVTAIVEIEEEVFVKVEIL